MGWEVEYTDEFGSWWTSLSEDEQDSINFGVRLLQERGPNLKRTFADTVSGSSYPNMKELRFQHEGSHTGSCMHLIPGEPGSC